jgi:cytochrome P450
MHQLSTYADVSQALNDARLVYPGQRFEHAPAQRAVRAAVALACAPARMDAWRAQWAMQARQRLDVLPDGVPVDLVGAFAEPWSLGVARQATGLPDALVAPAHAAARRLFEAAAAATDATARTDAGSDAIALARLLASPAAPAGGIADVQTFVALSHSLPALLAGAWWALLCHPDALAALLSAPEAVERSLGELLRLGSPVRAVFREATETLTIGDTTVLRGDRVALMLGAANRDPTRFADPYTLDLARDTTGHLGLGAGPHHCAGTALVRLALNAATEALLTHSATLAWAEGTQSALAWRGGFSLRAPAALWVLRQRRDARHPPARPLR